MIFSEAQKSIIKKYGKISANREAAAKPPASAGEKKMAG
jgi:hypothetical protein